VPRTRFEDDPPDDHFPARPGPAGNGGLLVVLLVAGALLGVVVCGGGLAVLLVARTAVRDQQAEVAERQAAVAEANRAEVRAEAAKAGAAKGGPGGAPVVSRKEFEAAVRGRKRDEIVAALGRPDETRERVPEPGRVPGPDGRDTGERLADRFDWWVFRDRVRNEATGKPYATVRVRFGPDGTADRIEYP
jgi:hypothetical protein